MRKPLLFIAAALLALSCLAAEARAKDGQEQDALAAARKWLKLVDSGQFAQSHQSAHPKLSGLVPRRLWEEKIRGMRGDLGITLSRRLRLSEYSGDIKPPPAEEFYLFAFDTEMSKGGDMEEVVTCRRGHRGAWQVADYYLHLKR